MVLSFCFFLCFAFIRSSILLFLFLFCLVKGSRHSHSHSHFGSSKRKLHYYQPLPGDMNIIMQNLPEVVRPLVGSNGWDYCVYWKLSEDQRFIEWMGCCCAGADNTHNNNTGEEEHLFPVSSCRDSMFPHHRTKPCTLLSQLPTSMPLDSGIHAQTLLTNQPNWVNYSNSLDSNILEETTGTRVLIPVAGGLVELFVMKKVPEDHQVIDFITAQCIALVEQEAVNHSITFNVDINSMSHMQPIPVIGDENAGKNTNNNHFQPPMSPITASETSGLPHDIHLERIRLCSSSLNFMQQFHHNPHNRMKNDAFFEESQGSFFLDKQSNPLQSTAAEERELQGMDAYQHDMHMQFVETSDKKEQQGDDKDLIKHGVGRSDSMSDCSDQNDEEDIDAKYRRRNGKGNQSKNLVAERKRRKKLNDRLYNLRSLVPRISKLDRASILGDAIEFVKDLQKQVKELQDELEEHSDTGGAESNCINGNNRELGPKADEHGNSQNGFHVGTAGNGYLTKQKQEADATSMDKQTQQMEPQVEVALIDGNEYFVKVFCEHRRGGFMKLMESLNALGMDVVHATVTSHKGLVSNVFKVEKRDSEMVEAEDVRDSLLELTRNPSGRGWTHEMTTVTPPENATGRDPHQLRSHNHHMGAHHFRQFHC